MSNKQSISRFTQQPFQAEWKAKEVLASSKEAQLARTAAELHIARERAVLEKMRDASVAKFKEKFGNLMKADKASVSG